MDRPTFPIFPSCLQHGDTIAILGSMGEHGIIARSLAGQFGTKPTFNKVEIYHNFNLDQEVLVDTNDIIPGEATIKVAIFECYGDMWERKYQASKDQFEQTFDWVFTIVHHEGAFGPELIGGKKWVDKHN